MNTLRCGVIGLGRLGYRHAANLVGSVAGASLYAVSDSSKDALFRFGQTYPSVLQFSDYQDLLALRDLDAVIIASSTTMHAPMIEDAIRAGKAIFCEKPVSLDLEEAKAIQTLVIEHDAFVQLGFMRRFDTAYRKAKERIDRNEVGRPISLLGISRDPSCPPIKFAASSGGLILDLCVHDLDLCRWYAGSEAVEIYARGGVVRYKELAEVNDIDHVNIDVRFANGFLASLEGSRNSQYGYDVRTEIVCSEGALFVGSLQDAPMQQLGPKGIRVDTIPGFLERFAQAYLQELECFVLDVLGKKKPSVGVEDGVAALELCLAANVSLATNRPVTIPK
ncbi:MAG TPA: inositol 2-dehydrogenase [Sphaerochaeta sp.]|jgi:scyllo-inositol 2-dehydrogenase (NAD+)|nr:inositol 2-dehydrogenase [Sphaerochaeta sp.]